MTLSRAWLRGWLPGVLWGASGAYTLVEYSPERWALDLDVLGLVVLVGVLGGAWLAGVLIERLIAPRLGTCSRGARWGWVLGSFGTAVLVLAMLPMRLPELPVMSTLEVRCTGEQNPQAGGREVWVSARDGEGTVIPQSRFAREGYWELRNGMLLCPGKPATVRWQGYALGGLELTLVTYRWSGIADIRWNGQQQRLDLFQAQSAQRKLRLNPDTPLGLALLLGCVPAAFLSLLVLAMGVWLVFRPARGPSVAPGRWEWALYALPCLVTWSVWWLTLWPAAMSGDSIDQWNQMITGHYYDVHPVFHTLSNWLITRLWNSPAMVACIQMLSLACTVGWGLATLRRYGLSRAWAWGIGLLFALSPVNGVLVITLWKDVPYSIALLLLNLFVVHIVFTRGEWLTRRSAVLALGGVAALVMLYRHNGFGAALGTLGALLAAYPRQRRALATALLLSVGLWVGTQAVLNRALHVTPARWVKLQPIIGQVAAHVDAGTPLTEPQRTYLDTLHPLEDKWHYTCATVVPLLFDGHFQLDLLETRSTELLRLWWKLLRSDPGVNLRHMLCISAHVWRLSMGDSYLYTFAAFRDAAGQPDFIAPNTHGLVSHSWLQPLVEPLMSVMAWCDEPEHVWFVCKPAFYLLWALGGMGVMALRARSVRFLVLAAPVGFQSALMMGASICQDFRFQYGVYLAGLLLGLPLLLGRLSYATPPQAETPVGSPPASA